MDWKWLDGLALVALNNLVLFIWKPWASGYAGEKSKNLARKEDLDKILDEVRAVTKAQKEIEAKISGEARNRQWLLDQKADVYGRILRAASEYSVWLMDLSDDIKFRTGHTTGKSAATIAEEFYGAYAISAVFLSGDSRAIVEKIKPAFFFHSSLAYQDDTDGGHAWQTHEKLASARDQLILSARKDMGISDSSERPPSGLQ